MSLNATQLELLEEIKNELYQKPYYPDPRRALICGLKSEIDSLESRLAKAVELAIFSKKFMTTNRIMLGNAVYYHIARKIIELADAILEDEKWPTS